MEHEYAEELKERFLRYVAVPSESDATVGVVPSTEGQRELARLLESELRAMGLEEIELDEHSILTAKLTGNVSGVPSIGFVAHLDTVPVSLSPEVHPQVLHYEGGDVCLNAEMRDRTSFLRTAPVCWEQTTRLPSPT